MAAVPLPIGDQPLNTISRADVEDVVSSTSSAWRANDVAKVLRIILGRAVKAGKIATEPGGRDRAAEDRAPRTPDAVG